MVKDERWCELLKGVSFWFYKVWGLDVGYIVYLFGEVGKGKEVNVF